MALAITDLLDDDLVASLDEQSYVAHILPLLAPESNVMDDLDDDEYPISLPRRGHFHEFDDAFWG